MIKVEVTDEKKIKIYNNGVLIIEEKNYNNVVSIINELKEVIQDEYQLNVLEEILKLMELRIAALDMIALTCQEQEMNVKKIEKSSLFKIPNTNYIQITQTCLADFTISAMTMN